MSDAASTNASIRRTIGATGDPRVARTRSAIAAAVHALSDRGEPITVASIIREAGISRASFYSHYASLDMLADTMRRDAFVTISDIYAHDPRDRADAMWTSHELLVAHYAENRALYSAVAALPVSKDGYLAGVRSMAALIEEALDTHPNRPADLQPEATARYIAGAAHGLLDAWITDEVTLNEQELVEHLTRLLPSWFSGLR
ncbi:MULTISPECIES: TetR/AcrR family transcriptional regulator [Microbacteriaceae]|uniref:TetR/AcrR family transcriptional regulator n=1 Tax=Antiquaquibacter soli TaxID=3064523 RepID=A0ABT9BT52_9MICO|nr:TetR/AcrR family transcriptional regulator [Protaetiibacter sp. WY-16]MDO7882522.1 TetR/AcrR family transcriptional regulator [Protaetiibacter sp. WY-16]